MYEYHQTKKIVGVKNRGKSKLHVMEIDLEALT